MSLKVIVDYSLENPHLTLLHPTRSEKRGGGREDGSVPGNDAAAAGDLHAHRAGETAGHQRRPREGGTPSSSLIL